VDNIGDGRHNPYIANRFFGLTSADGGDLAYQSVTEDRYLGVARPPAGMVPTSSPPSPDSQGGRGRSDSPNDATEPRSPTRLRARVDWRGLFCVR
jgi:hypothetical protein